MILKSYNININNNKYNFIIPKQIINKKKETFKFLQ